MRACNITPPLSKKNLLCNDIMRGYDNRACSSVMPPPSALSLPAPGTQSYPRAGHRKTGRSVVWALSQNGCISGFWGRRAFARWASVEPRWAGGNTGPGLSRPSPSLSNKESGVFWHCGSWHDKPIKAASFHLTPLAEGECHPRCARHGHTRVVSMRKEP